MGHQSSDHWTCGPSAKDVGAKRSCCLLLEWETQCPAVQYIWVQKSTSARPKVQYQHVQPSQICLQPQREAQERGAPRQNQDGILWHNAHMHSLKKEVNAYILDLLAKMRVLKANSPCAVPGVCAQNGWNIQALHEPSFPQLQNNPLQTPPPMIQRPDKHTGGILVLYHRPGECTSPGEHPRGIQTPDSVYPSINGSIFRSASQVAGPCSRGVWRTPWIAGSPIWILLEDFARIENLLHDLLEVKWTHAT